VQGAPGSRRTINRDRDERQETCRRRPFGCFVAPAGPNPLGLVADCRFPAKPDGSRVRPLLGDIGRQAMAANTCGDGHAYLAFTLRPPFYRRV